MSAVVTILRGGTIYYPVIEEGVDLELVRKGSPGKIKFKAVKDDPLSFQEGDAVKFTVDGTDMFYGFVFKKKRSGQKSYLIETTCYDQLRYFKNKDTYNFQTGIRADEVLRRVAEDYGLNVGDLANTGFIIPSLDAADKTLFDTVQTALDETLRATTKMFVLYDDVGRLTLRNIEDMKLDLVLDADTAGEYSYESSIDSGTYNQIKLTFSDEQAGVRSVYIAKDTASINQWGVLQFTDKVEIETSGAAKADALLKLYNSKTRTLSVNDALGDVRVRPGCSVIVKMDLGDMSIQSYLMVESAKHKFKQGQHLMDLKLRGGPFLA